VKLPTTGQSWQTATTYAWNHSNEWTS